MRAKIEERFEMVIVRFRCGCASTYGRPLNSTEKFTCREAKMYKCPMTISCEYSSSVGEKVANGEAVE